MPSVDPSARPVYHPTPPSTAGVPMPPRGGDHAPGDHSPVPPGGSPPPPRGGYAYGPPPPSYGMPPGYDKPPPGSYNGSAAGHYGPPPPLHQRGPPPPPPYATGGYPPYGYGRPPPWAGMYEGAYGGGYSLPPSQQRPLPLPPKGSSRDGSPPHPSGHGASSPYPSSKVKGDGSPPKGDPTASSARMHHHHLPAMASPTSKSLMISPQEMAENLEDLERTKAQAAAELSLAEVKPIQTDYHFFVQDRKKKLRALAIAEVDQSLSGHDATFSRRNRRFLINSNLNSRLMNEWEDLSREEREVYFQKEEEDRRRFMEDDEVASRHCFTLTARIRSPMKKPEDKKSSPHERENDEAHDGARMDDAVVDDDDDMDRLPSPPLASHGVDDDHNHDVSDGSPGKRSNRNDHDGSPTKKNRPEEDDSIVEL